MKQESFYKKKWFTILMLIILAPLGIILMWMNKHWDKKTRKILTGIFSVYFIFILINSEQTDVDNVNESVEQNKEEKDKNKLVKADMNIEIEITDTLIDEDKVIIKGTTNLLDDAILAYQLQATEDDIKVSDGKWEIEKSIKELEKDNEANVYGQDGEYNIFLIYPSPGKADEQPKEVLEAYGGTSGMNITGGPGFYEAEDNSFKSVSINVEFDEDGIINPETKKEKEFENAVKEWEEGYQKKMIDHYSEAGVIHIEENPYSDFDVVNVYVPNEFKMNDENEKLYYVEEIGPLIVQDLNAHFKKDHDISVYFKYEDGSTMASQKMLGGWKIKK